MTMQMDELFFSEGKLELAEEDKYIWKTVLRTGQWALTPGMNGVQRKPLIVVRDGKSDTGNNVISLSELIEGFQDGAFEHVTVPMAQNMQDGDHADIAKNNTGFIRDLKIIDEDGGSKLKAAFDFTEPDIKERVLRGTIPNTSVGILYDFVRKSDAKKFPVALSHVALTHRPWIDNMEPFGVSASDGDNTEISSFEQISEPDTTWSSEEGLEFLKTRVQETLYGEFKLPSDFLVSDISPGKVKIKNTAAGIEWVTTFTMNEEAAMLPPINEWYLTATETVEEERKDDEVPEPILEALPVIEAPALADPTEDLQEAHALREDRFAQGETTNNGGLIMSDNLNNLNLSDLPEETRAAVEALQKRNAEIEEENRTLAREARKSTVEEKVSKWGQELGLSSAPGFLKEVRRILLSDDGNVAGVLLADEDHKNEEKVTATEIVERLIDALPKTEEGKIQLSAQVELTADNEKPPVTEGEERPLDERLKDARQALGKSTD